MGSPSIKSPGGLNRAGVERVETGNTTFVYQLNG